MLLVNMQQTRSKSGLLLNLNVPVLKDSIERIVFGFRGIRNISMFFFALPLRLCVKWFCFSLNKLSSNPVISSN